MGRPRTAKHPASTAPPEQAASETPPPNGQPTVTKAEAVRRAIAAGVEAPAEGAAYVKTHFGIEMDNKTFSLNRSQQRSRDAKAAGESTPRTRSATTPAQSGGIPAGFGSDVKELRALIEKSGGAEELQELIGQLSGLLGKYGASGLGELIEAIS